MLDQALKEWAVTVDALLAGQTILLLRKGGIRERQGRFSVAANRVLLFPTYEHQRAELLKPVFAQVPQTKAEAEILLSGWADITHIVTLHEPAVVARLQPWHIWNQVFVEQRLQWQSQRPLYGLLLRSHRLAQPVTIPHRREYGGCRSWVQLADPVDIAPSHPVLADTEYDIQVADILATIGSDGRVQQTTSSPSLA